jgi:repressor LexA
MRTLNSDLTDKQAKVLQFLKDHLSQHGRPPTRQEIADHFEFKSPNAAEDHLRRMVAKGFIVLRPGRARAIEIVARA